MTMHRFQSDRADKTISCALPVERLVQIQTARKLALIRQCCTGLDTRRLIGDHVRSVDFINPHLSPGFEAVPRGPIVRCRIRTAPRTDVRPTVFDLPLASSHLA